MFPRYLALIALFTLGACAPNAESPLPELAGLPAGMDAQRRAVLVETLGRPEPLSGGGGLPGVADYHLDAGALSSTPKREREALLAIATALRIGQISGADALRLQQTVPADPNEPNARMVEALAKIGGTAQDAEEARRTLHYAAEHRIRSAMALYGLSLINPPKGLRADPAEGMRWLGTAVDAGDSQAALLLGHAYSAGVGGPADEAKARALYQEAQRLGSGEAGLMLARMALEDRGLEGVRRAEAALRAAAETGSPGAMAAWGGLIAGYAVRDMGPKDLAAVPWLTRAAEAGELQAMELVGTLQLLHGITNKDPKLAAQGAKWLARCSETGRPGCLFALAGAYDKGMGMRHDPAAAAALWMVAAERGSPLAAHVLEKVRPTLSATERSKAVVLAAETRRGIATATAPRPIFTPLKADPSLPTWEDFRRGIGVNR